MRLLLAASVIVRLALAAALMFACATCAWFTTTNHDPVTTALAITAGVYALVIVYQVERETRKATR